MPIALENEDGGLSFALIVDLRETPGEVGGVAEFRRERVAGAAGIGGGAGNRGGDGGRRLDLLSLEEVALL